MTKWRPRPGMESVGRLAARWAGELLLDENEV